MPSCGGDGGGSVSGVSGNMTSRKAQYLAATAGRAPYQAAAAALEHLLLMRLPERLWPAKGSVGVHGGGTDGEREGGV